MRKLWISAAFAVLFLGWGSIAWGESNDTQRLAALDRALKAGVITQEEYTVKVAQLKGGAVDPVKKAALDDAMKNGLLTQQEYDAKLRALASATASAPGTSMASGGKKTLAVVDSVFNLPAFKVTVPADWTFDGAVLRSECGDGIPFLVYRAYSPDKLSGIQKVPQVDWYSAADPKTYKFAGLSPCNLHAPARAIDVAARIATDLRAGAQVVEMPPLTPLQTESFRKAAEQGHAQMEQMNRQFPPNFQGTWDLDMQRVKIRYAFEGRPVEEMLTVALTTWGRPVSVFSAGQGGIIQPGIARLTHTVVNVTAIRAPAGRLEETIATVDRDSSVEMVSEWNDAEIALIKRQGAEVLAAIQKNGDMLRDQATQFAQNMQQSNDRFHAWQQQRRVATEQKFAQDMQRKDAQARNFLDYVQDQTYYLDPSSGQTLTIKNQPGVSGYVGQNPSGGWTQLVPVSH